MQDECTASSSTQNRLCRNPQKHANQNHVNMLKIQRQYGQKRQNERPEWVKKIHIWCTIRPQIGRYDYSDSTLIRFCSRTRIFMTFHPVYERFPRSSVTKCLESAARRNNWKLRGDLCEVESLSMVFHIPYPTSIFSVAVGVCRITVEGSCEGLKIEKNIDPFWNETC